MSRNHDAEFLALQEALAGRFSLERELGRGGMGIVYLAKDVRLDRPVAIKLLPPQYAAQPVLRERFIREARTAAKLSHPNIVPIHMVDEVDEFVFFVMAYVEGETLGQRVRKRGPLAAGEAARVLREVSWALSYAHAQGVVHRDIKADNILLEAGSGRALVTDFGIAWVGESAGLTSAGEILGTPEYMSPEQASGESVDGRSDIYALGIVGHYALTAKLPFQGASAQATLAKQLTQAAPALLTVAPEVPGPIGDAIDRCLAKDPSARFQGGEELAEALGDVLRRRKEMPAAIRVFIEQNRESSSAIVGTGVLFLSMGAVITAAAMSQGRPPTLSEVLGMLTFPVAISMVPIGMLGLMARRLLKSGYGHGEMVAALRADVEERRREIAAHAGPRDGLVDVWAPRLALAGLALLILPAVVLFVAFDPALAELMGPLMAAGLFMGLGGGIVTAARHGLEKAVAGERWLGFWDSVIGRGLFGVAGFGLGGGGEGAGPSYHRTEVAIGMAAERLFDELPKDVRRSLGDLPAVVGALEAHAERMRARLEDLDRVLLDVGEQGTMAAGNVGKRESVAGEVQAARDAAEGRLRDVVAALENIRLELLRLHAGSGTIESMTADLTAARALADDMEGLVQARGDVDALLSAPMVTPPEPDTPVPA